MVECLLLTQATDMEAVILFGGPDRIVQETPRQGLVRTNALKRAH
jgi:hypothetical protein